MRAAFLAFILIAVGVRYGAAGLPLAPPNATADTTARQAHEAYVAAINSNRLDAILGVLSDDVVFLSAHEPAMVGKAAVGPWVDGHLKAFTTRWDKTPQELVVTGDWAFERYAYRSTDTPKGGGTVVHDTGWGLVIFHHDRDGKWRVARDAWSTDQPAPAR